MPYLPIREGADRQLARLCLWQSALADIGKVRSMEPANDNDPTLDYRLCIYFIQAMPSGAVKIGIAREPGDRLKQLQIGNHEQLRLVKAFYGYGYASSIEQTTHDLLKPQHIRGEWFEGEWHEIFRAYKLATMRALHPKRWDRYWAFAKARQNAPRLIFGWKWLWAIEARAFSDPNWFDGNDPQLELPL